MDLAVLQWPLVFALVTIGIGLIYYFGPDADQDWVWITPGAVAATMFWLVVSLLFKLYVANFTDYEGSYGTVGGVIVVLLWFYVSGIAILTGAELNAEIEHASPTEKRRVRRTRRASGCSALGPQRRFGSGSLGGYRNKPAPAMPSPTPKPALGAAVAGAMLLARWWNRRGDSDTPTKAARTS